MSAFRWRRYWPLWLTSGIWVCLFFAHAIAETSEAHGAVASPEGDGTNEGTCQSQSLSDEVCDATQRSRADGAMYTPQDDVSWAITHTTLADPYHQALYDRFMNGCTRASRTCQSAENMRLLMNQRQPESVVNYTKTGYAKIPCPPHLWSLLNDFYQSNKGQDVVEYANKTTPYMNSWDVPTRMLSVNNQSLQGGGSQLIDAVWRAAKPILEEWTGQRLVPVSVYGIRLYQNASILTPHVDRTPLISSAIVNLDQEGLNEPWPLEVFGHDGKAVNVTMNPGEMVLYESHSVIHGRPFPLNGKYFANAFIHFEPIGPLDDEDKMGPRVNGIPPYVIPGSFWEEQWWMDYPNGWELLNDAVSPVVYRNLETLAMIAKHNPPALLKRDKNGWQPLHIAIQNGCLQCVESLLEHGASANDYTGLPGGDKKDARWPVELAAYFWGHDHPITQLLFSKTNL